MTSNIPDDDPMPDEIWSLCHKLYPTVNGQNVRSQRDATFYVDGAAIKKDKNRDFILEFVVNCSTQMSYIELRLRTHPIVNESNQDLENILK